MNPYDPDGVAGPEQLQPDEGVFAIDPSPFIEFHNYIVRQIADCFPGLHVSSSEDGAK